MAGVIRTLLGLILALVHAHLVAGRYGGHGAVDTLAIMFGSK